MQKEARRGEAGSLKVTELNPIYPWIRLVFSVPETILWMAADSSRRELLFLIFPPDISYIAWTSKLKINFLTPSICACLKARTLKLVIEWLAPRYFSYGIDKQGYREVDIRICGSHVTPRQYAHVWEPQILKSNRQYKAISWGPHFYCTPAKLKSGPYSCSCPAGDQFAVASKKRKKCKLNKALITLECS